MSRSRIDGSWFREENPSWEGYSISLEVEKVLYEGKSPFQEVLVFKSTTFGNVLVLDGTIQCTERDEASYQEMIAHLALNCHPNPTKVLVIGGGDGGVVREVLKYSSVKEVVLCEIDEVVIKVCKLHLPSMASTLSDPRVTIEVKDGISYVEEKDGEFDVIITDAPDPFGAAEGLYERDFYSKLRKALKPNGIVCCQGETIWFDLDVIKNMLTYCNEIFPSVSYASGNTPTYTGGQMGYMLCSNDPNIDFKKPVREFTEEEMEKMQLKYYTPALHQAAFKVLPRFAHKKLQGLIKQ